MRFDGLLGFPGGLVDPGVDPLKGANRELEEEIGLDVKKHKLEETNHVISFVNKSKNLVLHFYGKEFTMDEFREIELKNLSAPDYGDEVRSIYWCFIFMKSILEHMNVCVNPTTIRSLSRVIIYKNVKR